MDAQSESHLALKRSFLEFLDLDREHGAYASKVGALLASEEKSFRLPVDLADIRACDPDLYHRVMNEPGEALPAFEQALEETVRSRDPKWLPEGQRMRVGLTGEFGAHTVSPRSLLAPLMSKLVNVQGIVTKCSLVRPKMVRSVHYCEATKETTTREYRDVTSHDGAPTGSAYPTKDDAGNLLSTEFGLCQYRDSQVVTVQELPETAPPGQLPRSVDMILEDDLADSVKPGDRVEVAGVYKAIAPQAKGAISGIFRAIVCAVSVKRLTKAMANDRFTRQDITNIKRLSRQADVLEVLGNSLAPSIFGHSAPKQALVLLLLGGVEKNLPNGTHLRGDINCLFVGDPGVAKSQMLRAVMNIAPLAVNTTGRGSSGVGLTAAVTVDKDTGEKRLEAGAMVLADRGVVCIDEFDKMSDLDRVAIHEVMEQQTVTIAKAGIHTTLNARCSVVAAANPLYGTYEASLDKARNINLPDSLLSRFDMIFVMLDDIKNDDEIAAHVLGQHRYRAPGDDQGIILEQDVHDLLGLDDDEAENPTSEMFVKHDPLLHGKRDKRDRNSSKGLPLSHSFLKKYIHYAKERVRPELTSEASDEIASYYTMLRQFQACPKVTVRMLETIIRLSTAHAKLKLRSQVEVADVQAIKRILDEVTGFSSLEAEAVDEATMAKSLRRTHLAQRRARLAEEEEEEGGAGEGQGAKRGREGARAKAKAAKGKGKRGKGKRRQAEAEEAEAQDTEEEEEDEEAEGESESESEEEGGEEEGLEEQEAAEGLEGLGGTAPLEVGGAGAPQELVEAATNLLMTLRHEQTEGGVSLEAFRAMVEAEHGSLPGMTLGNLREAVRVCMGKFGSDAFMFEEDTIYMI